MRTFKIWLGVSDPYSGHVCMKEIRAKGLGTEIASQIATLDEETGEILSINTSMIGSLIEEKSLLPTWDDLSVGEGAFQIYGPTMVDNGIGIVELNKKKMAIPGTMQFFESKELLVSPIDIRINDDIESPIDPALWLVAVNREDGFNCGGFVKIPDNEELELSKLVVSHVDIFGESVIDDIMYDGESLSILSDLDSDSKSLDWFIFDGNENELTSIG